MNYIGNGLYTYKDVSHLTGLSVFKIRRWSEGYKRSDSNNEIQPVFDSDYDKIDSKKVLSFLDIIEILFIKAFHQYGISIQTIRVAIESASKLLNSEHPFAMKKIYTDGKTIIAKIAKESDSIELIDLLKKQYQFADIILPTLYECIDFNHYEIAEKWWPLGRDSGVVIDPARSFGKPIIDDINISTELIMDLYNSDHSKEDISNWYDIDLKYIEMAVDFEKRLVA